MFDDRVSFDLDLIIINMCYSLINMQAHIKCSCDVEIRLRVGDVTTIFCVYPIARCPKVYESIIL